MPTFFICFFRYSSHVREIRRSKRNIQSEINSITALKDAEQLKIKYLGRKGIIHDFMKLIPSLPAEQRAAIGQRINSLKTEVTNIVEELLKKFSGEATSKAKHEIFDITLPGKRPLVGKKHPITQTIDDIKEVFARLGFDVVYGPEVESEYYNFEALNIPADHPPEPILILFISRMTYSSEVRHPPFKFVSWKSKNPLFELLPLAGCIGLIR